MHDAALSPPVGDSVDAHLAECSREPIHIPGATQAHGVVLVIDPHTTVVEASRNADTVLEHDAPVLGRRLDDVIPGIVAAMAASPPHLVPATIAPALRLGSLSLHIVAHQVGDLVVLDLEEADPPGVPAPKWIGMIAAASAANAEADGIDEVARRTAELVHSIAGYDRVMIYRFHEDGHGEVIGEAVREGVERFLGLHYPASDIPTQARALFQLNRIRIIADSGSSAIPLLDLDGAPSRLDLSRCALRASSPIHLEYLRNMGVGASLTAAVTVRGRLWGLIACHHLTPRRCAHALRSLIDLTATQLAARIAELDARQMARAEARAARMQDELLAAFSIEGTGDWMGDIMRQDLLLRVVPSSAAVLFAHGAVRTIGATPGATALDAIGAITRSATADVAIIDDLPARDQRLAAAEGAVVSCLSTRIADDVLLVWLRREWRSTVTWGGDPNKAAALGDRPGRLSPRRSFAAWTEDIRGRAQPWTIDDLAAARAIVASLRGAIGRVYGVRSELAKSNRRLSDFAHITAHDLQEPLRSIRGFARLIERKHGTELPEEVRQNLGQIVEAGDRMYRLIRDVLDYASVQDVGGERSDVDLFEASNEAQATLRQAIIDAHAEMEIAPLPIVRGFRRLLIQILQNLIANAIKYRADRPPRIRVSAERDDADGAWIVSVRDNGIGIPEEHHERIFGIFQRVANREKIPGSGIGLAICTSIAEAHGGRIWVESVVGVGSTFKFSIADDAAP